LALGVSAGTPYVFTIIASVDLIKKMKIYIYVIQGKLYSIVISSLLGAEQYTGIGNPNIVANACIKENICFMIC
jgi:hypothetical protein